MRCSAVFLILSLLSGCGDDVGYVQAKSDGTCKGKVVSSNPNNNVQMTKVVQDDVIACVITFKVSK